MATYVDSHKAPGKGAFYDEYYATEPVLQYLWEKEQEVLVGILAEFYAGTPIDLLDFACGTGRIAGALEDKVRSATGVDVSESMLEVARRKLRRTSLLNANVLEQPMFPGRTFNLITAFRFFANAEPELRCGALRALEPLLADDGYLVFNTHQNEGAMFTRLARAYRRLRRRPTDATLSLDECRNLLAEIGLEIERVYPVGLVHLPYVNLPHAIYRAADRLASTSAMLTAMSESPIIVARRHREARTGTDGISPVAPVGR